VYALDDHRVLRVLKGPPEGEGREALLAELAGDADALPFRIPRVYDSGDVDGSLFTVEERIAGRSADAVLQEVDGDERRRALVNFADAAVELAALRPTREWFGYVARRNATRHASWSDFLIEQATGSVDSQRAALEMDVPQIDDVLAKFSRDVEAVSPLDAGIAHGDYFPGNVMLDDDQRVTAVIDFGVLTVHGDRRLDVAGAIVFFAEPNQWNRPGDAELLTAHLTGRVPSLPDVLELYRTYYALYFSHARLDDPLLYQWCLEVLRASPR
jgi:aminoglycoside phosphotransferase (APT) family kinase protein